MKKVLSLILTLVLVLSTFTPAFGASSERELYKESGEILKNLGVLQGSGTGDLMLDKKLKRQDMVVLVSRLHKEENTAKKFLAINAFTDVKDPYYKPYISWAVDKGLIVGTGQNKFGFNNPVTVQQFQTLLLRALGYHEEAKNWNNVPDFAKSLKLMEGLSTTSKQEVDRGLMAAMTVNALRLTKSGSSMTLAQHLNLDIPDLFKVDAVATVDLNTLKLEGVATGTHALKVNLKQVSSSTTTGEKNIEIPLKSDGQFTVDIPNLQSGKYEYTFYSGKQKTKSQTITIEELPFELTDVSATNLKEIAISFTSPVDKMASLFSSNYFTNAGTVKSVRLEDNDTKIILTLNKTMTNQKNYKISTNKITSYRGKEISIKDREFTAFDNEIPKVKEVKPLGNKGLRIYLSEPVKSVKASNFKIDDKRFSGNVDLVDNVITLTYFASYSAPKEGDHTLTVSGLEDYAGYKALDQNINFRIVKDTEAPKVLDASATIEEVIIQFDEEIDPASVSRTNFYWKSGSSKRYPTSTKVLNDKVILNFSQSTLPTNEISLYIDNVGDYSGNKLRDEEVKVKPTIDQTNPEVIGLKVSDDGRSIAVYYNKNVEAKNRAFYSIKDKNNRTVSIRSIEGSGREYVVNLNTPLPEGVNTINIKDVYDTTPLKNRLIDYSQQINMADVEKPKIISYSGTEGKIMLQFNKEMDPYTVENYNNYIIDFDGKLDYLPKNTEFTPLNDEAYVINLPEKINGKKVDIGRYGNLKEIQVSGLQATNGVLLDPITLKFDSTNKGQAVAEKAELVEPGIITVRFNQPIYSASSSDFSLRNTNIYDVRANGSNEVNIMLNNEDETTINEYLKIDSNNSIETIFDTGAKTGSIKVEDKVSPRIKSDRDTLRMIGNTIELPFTEPLDGAIDFFSKDLIIESSYGKILDESDYSISLDRNSTILKIQIKNSIKSPDGYLIRLVDDPHYIMDKNGNIAESSGYEYFAE